MKRAVILFLIMSMPLIAAAAEKKHIPTNDQDCSECHGDEEKAWLEGKHGLMNVKCVVCHGSPEENFVPKPGITRCRGCHGEEVDQVSKKAAKTEKTCSPCHEQHSLAVKAGTKTPFHSKGGKP